MVIFHSYVNVYQRVDDLITTAKWQFSTSQFALVHYVVDPAVLNEL